MRPWLGVVVAAVFITGGATAAAAAPSSSPGPAARAEALAGRLVAEMTFPAGTKPASLSSLPSGLRDAGPPGGQHWAHVVRILVAPVKPTAVWAALLRHKPFDETGTMGVAGDNGPAGSNVIIRHPSRGSPRRKPRSGWSRGTTEPR